MAEPARREGPDGTPVVPPVEPRPATASGIRRRSAGDSVTAMTTQSIKRYRDEKPAKRPPLRIRSWRAYWTTFRVIGSYLWLKLRARWHSDQWIEHKLREVHIRNARRIERTISELQGLFIKVGQLISIMTNFLPEEFRRELEGLQDTVPPRPSEDIEKRIVEELGKPSRELFAHFESRPIASASIGQVHLARMHDGRKVAVKVQ
jgi:predicted unusual protein kinase regulating ubiquinone biosynthesis (AarF/ABC1/UbiB family)